MLKYLLPLPFMLVAGCASINGPSNYVDKSVTKNEARLIAKDFVQYLKKALPPAKTALIIKKINTENNFTPLFITLLQQNGYKVTSTDQPKNQQNTGVNFITLTYTITPLNDGIMSAVYYDADEIQHYYVRTYKR
ncbi:hypothetical protein [Bartonella doshiae]|uniref:Conjugal transfer protein TrbH n=2 Tax=Bartonella doshiae TaxID=33044 RepID=A0A380ZF48_BARDO|nr:hypothetical protein [Bartonella doshiae]EJF80044.1 hypothetical protein MCS_01239 [Bartonella doshiae NCTC 12862 = ATCC 700133]MBB6158899.1 hypothetical protein [Bartonella doshiae]SUV45598.1 conjugal transfer protein TrbH [Bartonella doshiae]